MSDQTPAQRRRANRKVGIGMLVAFIEAGKPVPAKELELILALIKPSSATGQDSATSNFIKALQEAPNNSLTERQVFDKFSIGRPGCRTLIRKAVNKAEQAEDRIWILFDDKAGTYTFVNQGALPRWDGEWPGFMPRDLRDN